MGFLTKHARAIHSIGEKMNLYFQRASLKVLAALALSISFLYGCATTNDPQVIAAVQDKQFLSWLDDLTSQAKANPKYDRMPINTKAQEDQFLVWLHDAYRERISKHDLMRNINSTYPNHEYETSFIVSRLPMKNN